MKRNNVMSTFSFSRNANVTDYTTNPATGYKCPDALCPNPVQFI